MCHAQPPRLLRALLSTARSLHGAMSSEARGAGRPHAPAAGGRRNTAEEDNNAPRAVTERQEKRRDEERGDDDADEEALMVKQDPFTFQARGKGYIMEAGPLYMHVRRRSHVAGVNLGVDLSLRDLKQPLLLLRALFAEFLGTLVFLFIVITNIVYREAWSDPTKLKGITDKTEIDTLGYINTLGAGAHLMIAAAFGFTIFVVVFITAPISGGHINPAVTFGLTLARRITLLRGVLYVVVQCFGAILGSWLSMSIEKSTFDRVGGGVNGSRRFTSGSQITSEFIGTALLLFTVFAVVDPGRNQSVIHVAALGPFAIGMAVFVAHLALIPITGTSINPARSLGPAVAHGTWYKHWIFWLGPMTGAAFAAVIYELTLKGHTRAEAAIEPAPGRKPAAVETAAGAAPPPPTRREE